MILASVGTRERMQWRKRRTQSQIIQQRYTLTTYKHTPNSWGGFKVMRDIRPFCFDIADYTLAIQAVLFVQLKMNFEPWINSCQVS
jgi:hypothetical protein